MTVPNAVEVIAQLTRNYPDFIVGAGTVLDVETARRCVDAGARFITSTRGWFRMCWSSPSRHDVVAIPGALTPSEVIAAWKAGADFVKIFPCAPLGGDQYIRSLKVPVAADPPDRIGRGQSVDRGQLHLCRCLLDWNRVGADADARQSRRGRISGSTNWRADSLRRFAMHASTWPARTRNNDRIIILTDCY
jgi:tRNA-dihydrouridine synthase